MDPSSSRSRARTSGKTPEARIHAILLALDERGGRASAKDVAAALLNRSEAIGKRLLLLCQNYGLIAYNDEPREAELTDVGRQALREQKVFIPEHGAWRVWFTDDPLVPIEAQLLRIDTAAPVSARAEVGRLRDEKNRKDDTDSDTDEPKEDRTVIDPGEFPFLRRELSPPGCDEIRIDKVEPKVRALASNADMLVTVRFSSTKAPTANLSGTLDGQPFQHRFAPCTYDNAGGDDEHFNPDEFDKIWIALLDTGPLAGRWDAERETLRLTFDQAKSDEAVLRKLQCTTTIRQPSLPALGAFEPATVEGVPVTPHNSESAAQWANWLLHDKLGDYKSPAAYQALVEEVRRACPDFSDVRLPGQLELASRLRGHDGDPAAARRFWFVQAPLDWRFGE